MNPESISSSLNKIFNGLLIYPKGRCRDYLEFFYLLQNDFEELRLEVTASNVLITEDDCEDKLRSLFIIRQALTCSNRESFQCRNGSQLSVSDIKISTENKDQW